MKKQIRNNIEELDVQIRDLLEVLGETTDNETRNSLMDDIRELSELRIQLENNLGENSNMEHWIMGGLSLTGVALVLHYEKLDLVTSKAFSMVTNMFRGA